MPTFSASLLARSGLVRPPLPLYPLMTDDRPTNLSVLPPSYRTHPASFNPRPQESVHDQRRQAQFRQTGQLRRDRMLCPRCVSRKLARRCQGNEHQSSFTLCAHNQLLRALGLLQANRNTIRTPTRVAALSDLDRRIRARFRPGPHTGGATPTLTGRRRRGRRS